MLQTFSLPLKLCRDRSSLEMGAGLKQAWKLDAVVEKEVCMSAGKGDVQFIYLWIVHGILVNADEARTVRWNWKI